MTDTEAEATEDGGFTELAPDLIPTQLRTYGLAGEPVRMAPSPWQPVVDASRRANVGEMPVSAVQPILDAVFPDAGYLATDICLAHPPVGDFTATVTANSVRVDLAGDVDLLLPDENVEWNFGDGSPTIRDAGGWDHEYADVGTFTIQLAVLVAGRIWSSTQDVEIAGAAPPVQQDAPVSEGAFDPADHNVDDVLAYVEAHPDELGTVTSQEESGKARVTLLEKLYAKAG